MKVGGEGFFFYLINVVDKNSFELIFEKKKKDWRRLMKKLKILIFGIVLQEVGFLTFDSNIWNLKNPFPFSGFSNLHPPFSVEINIDYHVVLEFIIFFSFWGKVGCKNLCSVGVWKISILKCHVKTTWKVCVFSLTQGIDLKMKCLLYLP